MAGTVADVMVATLKASGVRRVYGVPGDSLNGFTDALRRDGGLAWQHMRHEEAAGFAAAGDAALTGALAVCAGSCGPGNLHLINGLFDANRSRVPVLAIAAQIPREEIGSGYFQETHPQDLFRECSVYCELVSIPGQLPRVLEIAMRTALARGGVAVVVIPGEIFLADAPADAKAVPVRAVPPVIRPDEGSLATAAEVLNAAGRSRSPCWRPRRWTTVTAVTRQPAPCSRPRKNSSIGSQRAGKYPPGSPRRCSVSPPPAGRGDPGAARTAITGAEILFRQLPPGSRAGHEAAYADVLSGRRIVEFWSGNPAAAVSAFAGAAAAVPAGSREQPAFQGDLALIEALRGRLARAAGLATAGVSQPEDSPAGPARPSAAVALAMVHLERNELHACRSQLKQAEGLLLAHPDRLISAVACLVAARGALAQAHGPAATDLIQRARDSWSPPASLRHEPGLDRACAAVLPRPGRRASRPASARTRPPRRDPRPAGQRQPPGPRGR